ncbi:MAG: hypothetical protein J7641_10255 [Cyanobacteria bacterium SID2]|nr:hypothetical protein [Cyanobacteria bacterium SID2]
MGAFSLTATLRDYYTGSVLPEICKFCDRGRSIVGMAVFYRFSTTEALG